MINSKFIRLLRRLYLIFCIFLGILSPIYCFHLLPEYNPMEQPLSVFGIAGETWLLWNSTLVFFSIAIFLNSYTALGYYFKNRIYRYPLKFLIILSSFCLFFTATIPMSFENYHRVPAFLFFFSYNLFVFLFGLFRSIRYLRTGMFSVFIGLSLTFSLLLLLPFKSYGVFEIVYFILIFIWNISFLLKRIKENNIKSNEKGILKFF